MAAVTLLVFLLSACDTGKLKIGEVRMMYGTNQEGLISYGVSAFTGVEKGSLQAERGQIITYDFDVTVSKGSLLIEWQNPDGEVFWSRHLVEGKSGHEDIAVELPGKYTILVQGKGFGGSFEVTWETK